METNSVVLAEQYYTYVSKKDIEAIKSFLDPDVEFYGPLATLKGKEAVITATSHFMNAFKTLTIRTKFGAGNQAIVVYDSNIPGISDKFPGASLLTFRNGQIVKIELFYDGSRFQEKKKEIFSTT